MSSILIEVAGGTALTVALFMACEVAGWWLDGRTVTRDLRKSRREHEALRRVTRTR